MFTSTKKEPVHTCPVSCRTNDDLLRPTIRPAYRDIRIKLNPGGTVQKMTATHPQTYAKMTIDTLEDLNTYYQLQNDEYNLNPPYTHIDISAFTIIDATITLAEVNEAIHALAMPSNPSTDITEIMDKIKEIRDHEAAVLQDAITSIPDPKPHWVKGKKGKFIGMESEWHIHLVSNNDHLTFGTDNEGRIDLHKNGTNEYKSDELLIAAEKLTSVIPGNPNAMECYRWLWHRWSELNPGKKWNLKLP